MMFMMCWLPYLEMQGSDESIGLGYTDEEIYLVDATDKEHAVNCFLEKKGWRG